VVRRLPASRAVAIRGRRLPQDLGALVAVQADEHRAARVAPRPVLGRVGVRVDACFAEIDCRNEYPGASFAATSYALPPCLRVVAQSIG
jgi:hypothetical protein